MTPVTDEKLNRCHCCGMPDAGGYHPYAACLMYMACHDSETVRANLDFVREQAYAEGEEAAAESVRELRGALQDILQHWRVVGGPMAEHGAIYAIAMKALQYNTEQTGHAHKHEGG